MTGQTTTPCVGWGVPRAHRGQSEVSSAVNMADSLTEPVCLKDFESYAREYLPFYAFEFFAGGANEETTIRENLEAFKRCENLTTQLPIDLIRHSVKRFGLGDTFNAIYLSISCCVTCTLTCRKVTCILDQPRLLICLFSSMLLELCVWWRGNWTSTVNY